MIEYVNKQAEFYECFEGNPKVGRANFKTKPDSTKSIPQSEKPKMPTPVQAPKPKSWIQIVEETTSKLPFKISFVQIVFLLILCAYFVLIPVVNTLSSL